MTKFEMDFLDCNVTLKTMILQMIKVIHHIL